MITGKPKIGSNRFKVLKFFKKHPKNLYSTQDVMRKFPYVKKASYVIGPGDLAYVYISSYICYYTYSNEVAKRLKRNIETFCKIPYNVKKHLPISLYIDKFFKANPTTLYNTGSLYKGLSKFVDIPINYASILGSLFMNFSCIKMGRDGLYGNITLLKKKHNELKKEGFMFPLVEKICKERIILKLRRRDVIW